MEGRVEDDCWANGPACAVTVLALLVGILVLDWLSIS